MSLLISSYMPFPTIAWCADMLKASVIFLDNQEPYRKMTFRNKYEIATANGRLKLSIPLLNGRNQRVPMSEVQIFNEENWQQQHYKSIKNAYNRSPFFEYYELELQRLFTIKYDRLIDFNKASIDFVMQSLRIKKEIQVLGDNTLDNNNDLLDWRNEQQGVFQQKPYYQLFENKNGFLPNLSSLDLIFNEGNLAVDFL
ncbi:MAG: WbqC family protein [Bacteroidota bacterium]|nr:WbqC family protein [Bacteroidota bacterium]